MVQAAHEELLRRRERLLLRSAGLRADWAEHVQGLRRPLQLADRARAAGSWLAQHPQWPIGAAIVLVLVRPSRALRWTGYALQGLTIYHRLQKLQQLASAHGHRAAPS